jgi:4-amino-4-deoxy-L-arabinose transferase-like glycosyltransferase
LAVIIALLALAQLWKLWQIRLGGWRDGFLAAATTWGAILVAITETLSRVNRITFGWVLASWVAVDLVLLALMWRGRRRRNRRTAASQDGSKEPDAKYLEANALVWAMLTPLGVIGATLAVVGFRGPPSNYDAMVYHMPRVLHWIQDGNVAFYPTPIPRQLEMPPGAEYIILHMQILSGGDRLADLVQWFAWVGCMVGVSAIARLLGAEVAGQVIAAIVAGTLPMACLQATTTQNDLVAAFWIAVFFWAVLRTIAGARRGPGGARWLNVLLCGLALGLAMLTKTTNYLYAAPAVVALVLGLLWIRTWRAPVPLAVVAILAVALNGPVFLRNWRFTHTLLGTGGQASAAGADAYLNSRRGAKTVVSNFLRNAGLEMIVPSDEFTGQIEQGIRAAHGWMGMDADDPATTWQLADPKFQLRAQLWDTEDNASNPVQFALILLAALLVATHCRKSWRAVLYGLGILLAVTAFCYALRWQSWNARLHLPIMVAAAPLVGIALERHMSRRLALVIAALLPWLSVPVIAQNYNHPLIGDRSIFSHGHDTRYFLAHPGMQAPFRAIVDAAAAHHCREVGLIEGSNDWEYPLDMMLAARLPDVQIEFYPGPGTLSPEQLHTQNTGWNDAVRPYLVARISGETASVVKIVDP